MRTMTSPRAGLVVVVTVTGPSDWAKSGGEIEANLGHGLGWTCEVGKKHILLLDPLGEGYVKAPVPELSDSWLDNVRHDQSCAFYIAVVAAPAEFAELTIRAAAADEALWAATVRTAIADDYGQVAPPGRNQPCHCGSGKKYKHCHG